MDALTRWVYFVMEGQVVQRFHTRPFLVPVTDAQHSHGVAMLVWYLSEGGPSVNLLMAALTHDLGEQAASDVSSPAKRSLNLTAKLKAYEEAHLAVNELAFPLTDDEAAILNLADQFEGMLSCVRERFMGNMYTALPYCKWYRWTNAQRLTPRAAELRDVIHAMWMRAESNREPQFDVYEQPIGETTSNE